MSRSTALHAQADSYKIAFDEIQGFESLQEGWDHEGGRAISKEVRQQAIHFLDVTRGLAPTPDVLATPEGGIDMIWRITLPQGAARVELHVIEPRAHLLVRVHGVKRHLYEAALESWQADDVIVKFLKSRTS